VGLTAAPRLLRSPPSDGPGHREVTGPVVASREDPEASARRYRGPAGQSPWARTRMGRWSLTPAGNVTTSSILRS